MEEMEGKGEKRCFKLCTRIRNWKAYILTIKERKGKQKMKKKRERRGHYRNLKMPVSSVCFIFNFIIFTISFMASQSLLSSRFSAFHCIPPSPPLFFSFHLHLRLHQSSLILLLFSTLLHSSLPVPQSDFFTHPLCHVKSVHFTCPFLRQPVYHCPRHTCTVSFL